MEASAAIALITTNVGTDFSPLLSSHKLAEVALRTRYIRSYIAWPRRQVQSLGKGKLADSQGYEGPAGLLGESRKPGDGQSSKLLEGPHN